MSDKKPSYKEQNGTTRLGDFLRSVNFTDVAAVVGAVATGNIKEALSTLSKSKELTESQITFALKELEMDSLEMQELTERLKSDNEHNITRLVRPITYGLMFILFISIVILDGNIGEFVIKTSYIPVIESLFTTMTVFYFGSRGLEKMMKTFKSK